MLVVFSCRGLRTGHCVFGGVTCKGLRTGHCVLVVSLVKG